MTRDKTSEKPEVVATECWNRMESVSRRCMIDIACELCRDWKKFGYVNGLSKEVEQIDQDYKRNVFEQAYRILQAWQQKKGSRANYQELGESFRSGTLLRIDLAEKYCEGRNQSPSNTEKGHLRTGKVSDTVIEAISNELGTKWIWVGRLLGLEDTELDDIRENNGSLYECSHTMLLSWTQKSTSQATYEWLAQALGHTAVGKGLIAQKYCIQDISVSQRGASFPLGGEDIQHLNIKMETLQVCNPTEGASKLDDDGVGSVEKMNDRAIGSRNPLPVPDDCIQKKFITNLPYKVWAALVVKLDPPRELGGDFKDLAGEMGFTTDQILYFKSLKNPTETVLNGCSSRSIEDLCNKLDVIGRGDARLEIDKWIKTQDCKCALCITMS